MNFNDINYERTDYNRVKDIYEKASIKSNAANI